MTVSDEDGPERRIVEQSAPDVEEQNGHSISLSAERSFTGPIPPPWTLREYEEILPGSADRILSMAEREASARHERNAERLRLSAVVLAEDAARTRRGMYIGAGLGLALLGVALALALEGATWPAVVAAVSQLAPTAAIFIPRARARWRRRTSQRESDNQQQ